MGGVEEDVGVASSELASSTAASTSKEVVELAADAPLEYIGSG